MNFDILDEIRKAEISPHFKTNTLEKINNSKVWHNKQYYSYNWFTPKLQLTSIALVVLMNTLAILYVFQNNEDDSFDNFAEQYSLKTESYFEIKNLR